MAGSPRKPDMRLVSGQGADGYADMIARARALIPDLRERAPRTEALRRLPPETERALSQHLSAWLDKTGTGLVLVSHRSGLHPLARQVVTLVPVSA